MMISKWLSNIRSQMILVFSAFSVLIAIFIVALCLNVIHSTMQKQAIAATENITSQVNTETRIMIDEGMRLLQWGDVSDVTDFLYGTGERYAESSGLVAALSSLHTSKVVGDHVRNIYIFDTDGYGYNDRTGLFRLEENERFERILNMVVQNPNSLLYLPADGAGAGDGTIVIGDAIRQTATRIVLGYIAVELRADAIANILNNVTIGESGSIFLLDENDTIILGDSQNYRGVLDRLSNVAEDGYETVILSEGGETLIAVHVRLKDTRWSLVGCVPMRELMSDFNTLLGFIVLMSVVVLLAAIVMYIMVSKRITSPIQRLKKRMLEAADGNLNAVVTPISRNEFSVLEKQYNRLLNDIRALIQRNQEEQINLQKAELRALQAQINPHFLYNTLDTLIWLVAAGENDSAIRMVEQLSVFFQIGLSKGLDWISVREEVEHLYSYLYIQRVRYSDLLDFKLNVDDDILDCGIPKMTLQPIVENAIYHGIKNKKKGGQIVVTGRLEESGSLLFTIADTGVGMQRGSLLELQEQLKQNAGPFEDKIDGFGLYNVNRRIKLYCGNEYGLTIQSEVSVGTTVTIRVLPREAGR